MKICPFKVLGGNTLCNDGVPCIPYREIKNEYPCYAWIPAKLKIKSYIVTCNSHPNDPSADWGERKQEEYQPGYCKLIGEIQ